ncbi:L-type lectin-domain containing receptor kinase IX.1-like [Elaeis guineensis]|uniref:L-type lectin-domain containing receptor kinase IX.1-like n=1 Tax=Elaeis guineensis var. tenera TaxID=51953 RepID=UPI003C6D9458
MIPLIPLLPLRLLLLLSISSFLPTATPSTHFNFTSFTPNTPGINFSGDAFTSGDNVIQLTRNSADGSLLQSSGHAVYATPIQLWNPATLAIADFTTHFRFIIKALHPTTYGDGLAFFIAPVGYELPLNSNGSWLGLFNSTTNNSISTQLVAIEFDTFMNSWDPDDNHIGINVNSIVSNVTLTWGSDIKNESTGSARIGYNSTSGQLSVFLTYGDDRYNGTPSLWRRLNLTEVLPERVIIGFSASTGGLTELHQIISWDFSSSFVNDQEAPSKKMRKKTPLVAAVVVGVGLMVACFGYFLFIKKKSREKGGKEADLVFNESMEDKLAEGTGPRRFTYKELVRATRNFSEEGKLGQGGFGGVYMGLLKGNPSSEMVMVAVKRFSRGSSQGRKEYVSEVTIIGRLRHRNLVRLIGWCHDNGEFLLVYEYMPNGSLDAYLFGKKSSLSWPVRYRIVLGLASALLYLHEEWEQCVVHRDIKASNVMLDSSFNAKLGDFGLARLVDHELGSQTTVLAGTLGYLAPECVTTGKAGRESDVYSFGVVVLEVACGRKAIDPKAEEVEQRLVDWVWELYERGRVVEAADGRLEGELDERQMERVTALGLWCAQPDYKLRPSMRQVVQVLTAEAPVPSLPKPMKYDAPPVLDVTNFACTGTGTMDSSSSSSRYHGSSQASSGAHSPTNLSCKLNA